MDKKVIDTIKNIWLFILIIFAFIGVSSIIPAPKGHTYLLYNGNGINCLDLNTDYYYYNTGPRDARDIAFTDLSKHFCYNNMKELKDVRKM